MKNRFTLTLNPVQGALALIVLFTLLQGFFNALSSEYVTPRELAHSTFLFQPTDLHGDLIKTVLAVPPMDKPHIENWSPIYQLEYDNNAYVSPDLSYGNALERLSEAASERSLTTGIPQDFVTNFHIPPATLLVYLLLKRLLLATSPEFLIWLFYTMAFVGLASTCWVTCRWRTGNDLLQGLLTFVVFLFSYPFLMILTRANIGALIGGLALTLFVFEICCGKRLLIACLLLVVAGTFHPNNLLLAPLLLSLSRRWFWPALIGVFALFTVGFALATNLDGWLYPGYSYHAFLTGLKLYRVFYLMGTTGDQFNNSAYGCLKTIIYLVFGGSIQYFFGVLGIAAKIFFASFTALILISTALFIKNRLRPVEFAFVVMACCTLATPVSAIYHLFSFAGILLVLVREVDARPFFRKDYIILGVLVFIFVPKNYFFIDQISWEVILNPVILMVSVGYLLLTSRPVEKLALSGSVAAPNSSSRPAAEVDFS